MLPTRIRMRTVHMHMMLIMLLFFASFAFSFTNGLMTKPLIARTIENRCREHSRLHMIAAITSTEEFESKVSLNKESSKAVIMLFKKNNCKPCQKIAPQLDELIEKYKDKIDVYEIKADTSKECLGILKKEGVRTVPTFQFYKGGEKVDHVQGARIDEVEEMIKSIVP